MGEISQSIEIGSYGHWVRVRSVFDSGAEISYVDKKSATKINALPLGKPIKTFLADGSEAMGVFSQIRVKIGHRIGTADVIIVPYIKDADILLGQDFMQNNDIILDLRNERIIYGKGQPIIKREFKM